MPDWSPWTLAVRRLAVWYPGDGRQTRTGYGREKVEGEPGRGGGESGAVNETPQAWPSPSLSGTRGTLPGKNRPRCCCLALNTAGRAAPSLGLEVKPTHRLGRPSVPPRAQTRVYAAFQETFFFVIDAKVWMQPFFALGPACVGFHLLF